jgi:tol-pal system protein YbgF
VILGAAATLSSCALMQPPEEDPVQIRLNDLDSRLQRIERVVTNQSLVELAQRLERMQGEVRQLRGEIEQLENQTQTGQKQQRDLYTDIDRRLAALEGGRSSGSLAGSISDGGAAGGGFEPRSTGGAGSVAEQRAYDQAFDALKAADYARAITGFRQFLTTYPDSALASNAQYWLGEAYYVTRDYTNAASAFQRVVNDWPDARKAPDALVKLGFTQFEQKRFAAARTTLREVGERYPGTESARLAADRLKRIPPDAR